MMIPLEGPELAKLECDAVSALFEDRIASLKIVILSTLDVIICIHYMYVYACVYVHVCMNVCMYVLQSIQVNSHSLIL